MILKNKARILFFNIILLISLQCSQGPDNIAGGTTDSGNAKIAATVVYNGQPVSHAKVRIRPVDYLINSDPINSCIIDTTTNDSGRFYVNIHNTGGYALEVIKNDTLAVFTETSIMIEDDSIIVLDTLSLTLTGTLSGSLQSDSYHNGVVKLAGLEHQANIDDSGNFNFPNLAPGDYTLVFQIDNLDTLEIFNVTTVSGKSSMIQNINVQQNTWQLVVPETYLSDSLLIEAFLDSQKIETIYQFETITGTSDGRIRTLDLTGLGITELHPAIGVCDFLYTLNLSNNKLTMLPPEIEKCRLLSALVAENNVISEIPVELSRLRFLEFLKLSNNNISSLLDSIFFLPKLRKLSIGANPIDTLTALIGKLTTLEQLDIFECNLEKLPQEIGNLTNLHQVWANKNQLQSLPESITNLSTLQILQLSNNALTSLPQNFGLLISLKEVSFYNNDLRELPATITNLTQIENLNIDKNSLCTLSAELVQWVENHTDPDWLSRQENCQ